MRIICRAILWVLQSKTVFTYHIVVNLGQSAEEDLVSCTREFEVGQHEVFFFSNVVEGLDDFVFREESQGFIS